MIAEYTMSFLLRNARGARPVIARPVVSSRTFMNSVVRALKEDDRRMFLVSRFHLHGLDVDNANWGFLGTDTEDQAENNERHKQDQLKKQKEGKGHWKPELASNSEEAVSFLGFCERDSADRFSWE